MERIKSLFSLPFLRCSLLLPHSVAGGGNRHHNVFHPPRVRSDNCIVLFWLGGPITRVTGTKTIEFRFRAV